MRDDRGCGPAEGPRGLWRAGAALLCLGLIGGCGTAAARPRTGDATAGRLLVADGERGRLRVYDLGSNTLLATVDVGRDPVAVVAARDGRTAWVADRAAATLTVVDLQALRAVRIMPLEGIERPCSLAIGDGGRWLLVGGESGRRLVQVAADRSVITRAITTTEDGAHRVAAAHGGSRAFVANQTAASLTEMEIDSLRIGSHWPLGAQPGALAAGRGAKRLVVTLPDRNAVLVLDGGGRELSRLSMPGDPRDVLVLPSATQALVVIGAPAGVLPIDLHSLEPGPLRTLEGTPDRITADGTGTRVYVGGRMSAAVSILSMPAGEVVGRIETGGGTSALAWAAPPLPDKGKRKR